MIYGYGRVSTKGQAKDGKSLEAQERLLKEHGAEVIITALWQVVIPIMTICVKVKGLQQMKNMQGI